MAVITHKNYKHEFHSLFSETKSFLFMSCFKYKLAHALHTRQSED